MTTLRKLANISLIAALAVSAAGACSSDDDDDDDVSTGGHAGATIGGALPIGGDNTPSLGGDTSSVEAGASTGGTAAGGTSQGGTATGGDSSATGGADADEGGNGGMGGAGGDAAIASLSDAQILLVLDTLNHGEVEEAYAALPRLGDADVEAFAQMMIDDHGMARQTVAATADAVDLEPQPSQLQMMLAHESEEHVAKLRSTKTPALDATYMAMQVAAHADALQLLDELDDVADAPQLTTLIADLTTSVQQHYDAAVEIEAGL